MGEPLPPVEALSRAIVLIGMQSEATAPLLPSEA